MGGIITLALSAMRRGAVAGVIFNDVGPEIAVEGVERIKGYVGRYVEIASWDDAADYMRSINGLAFPDFAGEDWQKFARRTFTENGGAPALDYDPAIMQPLAANKYKAATFIAWILFRRLARSRPTLLIRGALSDLVSAAIAEKMQRRAPRLQRVDVPRVGHAPTLSEAVASDAILRFLRKRHEYRRGSHRPARKSPMLLLLIAYIFNFLDRTILNILAGSIIKDLELTDAEFGAITGLAFAILYSVLGVPLAMLADRTRRSWVVAGSLTVWSAFTALCGTATSFMQLFIYRLGVGVGEAGGVAPSYALIADYFPPQRRARALAIFSLGIPIGLAAGTLIGAYLATWIDWRAAFLAMGIAGVLFAPVMLLFVRDLPRAAGRRSSANRYRAPSRSLRRSPLFG